MAQLTVGLVVPDPEVDTAFRLVRESFSNQVRDQFDDLGDLLGRLRVERRRQDIESVHVLQIRLGESLRYLLSGNALTLGTGDDLVVNVREVHHAPDFISPVLQITVQNFKCDRAERMANVRVVVHGDAAYVHTHLVTGRLELFFLARESVVKLHECGEVSRLSGRSYLADAIEPAAWLPPAPLFLLPGR